jgi:hypothetical protein
VYEAGKNQEELIRSKVIDCARRLVSSFSMTAGLLMRATKRSSLLLMETWDCPHQIGQAGCLIRRKELIVFNPTTMPKLVAIALLWNLGGSIFADASNSTPPARGMPSDGARAREFEYLEANEKAMTKMMQDMHIRPSGDVDRDFVAQMIAHHQGAIDMASALLHTGANETLKRLAQEIIVTQRDEIAVMRLAIGESPSGLERSP